MKSECLSDASLHISETAVAEPATQIAPIGALLVLVTTLSQWAPYLGVIDWTDAAATVEKCRARLAELKDKVQSELEKKQKDPNADADLSQFDALAAELTGLKTEVEAYNTAVAALIEKATMPIP
jgi:hypothetical protein